MWILALKTVRNILIHCDSLPYRVQYFTSFPHFHPFIKQIRSDQQLSIRLAHFHHDSYFRPLRRQRANRWAAKGLSETVAGGNKFGQATYDPYQNSIKVWSVRTNWHIHELHRMVPGMERPFQEPVAHYLVLCTCVWMRRWFQVQSPSWDRVLKKGLRRRVLEMKY